MQLIELQERAKEGSNVNTRIYRANSMTEAVAALRQDLGVDAVIPNVAKEALAGELKALLDEPTMPALAESEIG